MKKKIIHYFNQGADTYDAVAQVQVHIAEQLTSRLNNIHANHILEIGCGTGLFTQRIMPLFPQASLLLTDISPVMIKHCYERFQHHARVNVHCVDGERFQFQQPIDLIISSMTLHWFDNFERGFANMVKQLMPGARIVFAMLGENSLPEWRDMCAQYNVLSGMRNFPSSYAIKQHYPELEMEIEHYQHQYDSAHAFLSSLKQLGARAPLATHAPIASGRLRKLFRHHSTAINMTYEIIYGSYTKS
jgi:malonyl-CoA O-methyltransferase